MSSSTKPDATVAPTSALMRPITPSRWARIGCSIFIASSTMTRSPLTTASPSATAIFTTVACIGDLIEAPVAATIVPAPPRRLGAAPRFSDVAGLPNRAGSDTSIRLPPTSTTMVCRAAGPEASGNDPLHGSMSLMKSVSIQRV